MKKFLFSLIFVGAWAATLYFYGQQPESFPEQVATYVGRCSVSIQDIGSKIQDFLRGNGVAISSPWSETANLGVMAALTFIGVWLALSIIFGLRGFFKDLFSFFPLSK